MWLVILLIAIGFMIPSENESGCATVLLFLFILAGAFFLG